MVGHRLIETQVLPKFFLSLVISFIGTVVGMMFVPPVVATGLGIVLLIAMVIAAFSRGLGKRFGRSEYSGLRVPIGIVYGFTFLFGIVIYPIISYYLNDMGALLVVVCFAAAMLMFGSLAAYAYFSKKDFSFLGGILFISLIGLIVVSIIGIFFVQAEIFHVILSFIGLIIFSGYILYDISRMKKMSFTKEDVPSAVLDLYLDFINIFLDILRIVSFFTRD
jgi:uncharacterized protein